MHPHLVADLKQDGEQTGLLILSCAHMRVYISFSNKSDDLRYTDK
mgnify:FL=1